MWDAPSARGVWACLGGHFTSQAYYKNYYNIITREKHLQFVPKIRALLRSLLANVDNLIGKIKQINNRKSDECLEMVKVCILLQMKFEKCFIE